MAGECIPLFRPGTDVTAVTTAAVTGKKFVTLSAAQQSVSSGDGLVRVAAPAAGARVWGVAATDAASGARVTVIRGRGTILPVIAGAAITFVTGGTEVEVDATGGVITKASGVAVGRALASAANGAEVFIELY